MQLAMTGSLSATTSSCTWVAKAICGAPGIEVETVTTTLTDTDVLISVTEYTAEFTTGVTPVINLNGQSNFVDYLPSTEALQYYQQDSDMVGGTLVDITTVDSITSFAYSYSAQAWVEWKAWF